MGLNLLLQAKTNYLKDERTLAVEADDKFAKFSRPSYIAIGDYVIKFEQLYQMAKTLKRRSRLDPSLQVI